MKMIKKIASLLVLLVAFVALVGCAPEDPAAATEKLEKAEYSVVEDKIIIPGALKLVGVKGIESVLVATKAAEESTEVVTMVYFAEKEDAKNAFDEIKSYAEEKDKETSVKQSGNWVYYGTEQAVKDFE